MPKFEITRYDLRCKQPPFNHIKPFDTFTLPESFDSPDDYLGVRRYATLVEECAKRGYKFKFYTFLETGSYRIFVR